MSKRRQGRESLELVGKKLRRREEERESSFKNNLRKTYAKLDFKFLGAIRRGLNYSKDRKPSCVDDSLRRCNFPWRYAALSRWKKKKKRGGMVKRSRRRSKSTVASRLYFKDILRFPRVILVMIANRNQQGTFRTLANFSVDSIGISLTPRAFHLNFYPK